MKHINRCGIKEDKMTYIPDGRTDKYYNQKYLNKANAEFLRGFDWCTEMAVDNFFNNNYEKGFDDAEFVGHEVLQELPESEKGEYTMEHTFIECEDEKRKVETIIDKIRYEILSWIESERDMLITSMIDGMNEEEYKQIKAEIDKEEKR